MNQRNFTADHYGVRTEAYVQSQVHAAGEDLDEMEAMLRALKPERVLDLGCGGGHVSYRAAKYARNVFACDITHGMLEAVAKEAATKGLENIETKQAAAEDLPFEAGYFDVALCRFTAHHWSDFLAGLKQARRVIKPGGTALFIDTLAPVQRVLDTHLQAMEVSRDPSHVRNYSVVEWCCALAEAGFSMRNCTVRRLRMEFKSWTQRTRTPEVTVAAIRQLQNSAPESVRDYFKISDDGSFELEVASMQVQAI